MCQRESRKWTDHSAVPTEFGAFLEITRSAHGNGEPEYFDRFIRQISTLWLTVPTHTAAQFASITDPALVITGDRDELAALVQAERLYRGIPGAELAVLPGSSHGSADDDIYWALVQDFLSRRLAHHPKDRPQAAP